MQVALLGLYEKLIMRVVIVFFGLDLTAAPVVSLLA